MQAKFAVDGAQLGGLDQARVRDDHRVQRSLELFEPERQKPIEHRKPRTQVVVLPDIRLQERRMIGQSIENLRGREAVALELAAEVSGGYFFGCFFGCHLLSGHGCPPIRTPSLWFTSHTNKPKNWRMFLKSKRQPDLGRTADRPEAPPPQG